MSRTARTAVMLAAAAALLALYVWSVTGLPDFGTTEAVYGTTVNAVVAAERQATNAVGAIVFDYRAFDTLGEELILFISVVGVALLLREQRPEETEVDEAAERLEQVPPASPVVRGLGVAVVGATLLIGLYIVAHGQLTPGGGFQGGLVLGAAMMVVFVAGDFLTLRALQPASWMEALEAAGAAGLALLALGGLVAGGAFFHNFLYTGTTGELNSGGIIGLGNVAVGVEVFGATVLLAAELLQELTTVPAQGDEG